MNKIKAICDKYKISHRELGILIGYSRDHIQKVRTGKRKMTKRFARLLERLTLDDVEKLLKSGSIKIPN